MYKKFFLLAAIIPCLASPLSANAIHADNAFNEDGTYVEMDSIREYAAERGIYTDRFLFYNGPSHPIHTEERSSDDVNYAEYLKNGTNIQISNMPWTYYYSNIQSGRCFGMSLTSILAHNGVFSPSDIQEGKERLIDITADITLGNCRNDPVMQKIIRYQQRQDRPDFWLYMHRSLSEYNESEAVDNLLKTAKKAHDEGKYFLVIYDDFSGRFCHAVTAMGILDGEWEYNGEKYDKCIPIYDTNLLHRFEDTGETVSFGCSKDSCLFVNSETNKMYVPMYFEDGDVGEDFKVFTLDDENFMNYGGEINPSDSYNTDVSGIKSVTVKTYDKDYSLNVTKEDETKFDGIAECKRVFANNGKEYVFKGNEFELQNTGNAENFVVNFMDMNHAARTDFTGCVNKMLFNADKFEFNVSAPTDYYVSLVFEEGSYNFAPHYKFDLSGITDSDFQAIQNDRGVIISSSDRIQCQITITDILRDDNGLVVTDTDEYKTIPAETSQNDAVTTNSNVLLSFDENGNLNYFIGENYDTQVQKGDVNCDGFIDAIDASFVLQAYSANSTNSTSYVGKTLGDYNNDGLVDAVDASFILQKYAELSTTKS